MSFHSLNFNLGETIDMLRDTVSAFARKEIALGPPKSIATIGFPPIYGPSSAIWD